MEIWQMNALAYQDDNRREYESGWPFQTIPMPGNPGDEDAPPPMVCHDCYAEGYGKGFGAGAASVRKAPLITVDLSSLTGGIINIIAFGAMILLAGWLGEMRGMKETGRLNIQFEQAVPEKTDKGMTIRMREPKQ
jgi:hypothetical protein